MRFALSALALITVGPALGGLACGGTSTSPPAEPAPAPSATTTATATATATATVDAGPSDAATDAPTGDAQTGPSVSVHVRATQTPVSHDLGTSGQTPISQRMAFTSLTLYATEADTVGYKVFDLGAAGVEAGLNDKDDTVLTKLPVRGMKAGKYTFARAGVAHVRFKIRATMHAAGAFVAGELDNVQVLSDGAVIDGQPRKKGWYRYTFTAPGVSPQTNEGPTAPLPQSSGGAGIRLEQTANGMQYAFPVDLTVDPGVAADLRSVWELNTHENFRWTDQRVVNYAAGVFDTTPTVSEPVVSFGANSGRLFWEQ